MKFGKIFAIMIIESKRRKFESNNLVQQWKILCLIPNLISFQLIYVTKMEKEFVEFFPSKARSVLKKPQKWLEQAICEILMKLSKFMNLLRKHGIKAIMKN